MGRKQEHTSPINNTGAQSANKEIKCFSYYFCRIFCFTFKYPFTVSNISKNQSQKPRYHCTRHHPKITQICQSPISYHIYSSCTNSKKQIGDDVFIFFQSFFSAHSVIYFLSFLASSFSAV